MSAGNAGSIRVLLVNDFPIVAWGLQQMVEGRRPVMTALGVASTRAEALAALKTAAPDIVVVDIDGEHGPEAIHDYLAATSAKVLALTGSRDAGMHDRAVLAGANGVVKKTEPVANLLKAIERVHAGEIWLDRMASGRIFMELARKKAAEQHDPEHAKIAQLTRKERRAVAEVARDASATPRDIASRLCISEYTLRNHLTSIYAKLDLSNRLELYAYALKHGLGEAMSETA